LAWNSDARKSREMLFYYQRMPPPQAADADRCRDFTGRDHLLHFAAPALISAE
jgi:hypothetical protein